MEDEEICQCGHKISEHSKYVGCMNVHYNKANPKPEDYCGCKLQHRKRDQVIGL